MRVELVSRVPTMSHQPFKIVSGGQTGVDRAALDVARFLEIEHGGWCPHGRRAEDGRIADDYQLRETGSVNYVVRTEQNVVDSDGTLILFRHQLTGGTLLTERLAIKHGRPLLSVDLAPLHPFDQEEALDVAKATVLNWRAEHSIAVLNIAGPRESTCAGVNLQANHFLTLVFSDDCQWRTE